MAKYTKSRRADQDILRILVFGIERFGETQARLYHEGLEIKFKMLASNPKLGQAVDFIQPGLRRSVFESHAIYYRVREDDIRIVRVLGGQDINRMVFDE